jgi:hypothetical protein
VPGPNSSTSHSHSQPTTPEKQRQIAGFPTASGPIEKDTPGTSTNKNNYQNYFRFELKCGNTSFVYEKNINRNN